MKHRTENRLNYCESQRFILITENYTRRCRRSAHPVHWTNWNGLG